MRSIASKTTKVEPFYKSFGGYATPPADRQKLSKREAWIVKVPFGVWRTAGGDEVLFNRFYNPIFQRKPGQPARPANPHQWVHWVTQDYFAWPPDIAASNKLLKSWGLPPLPPLPKRRNHAG